MKIAHRQSPIVGRRIGCRESPLVVSIGRSLRHPLRRGNDLARITALLLGGSVSRSGTVPSAEGEAAVLDAHADIRSGTSGTIAAQRPGPGLHRSRSGTLTHQRPDPVRFLGWERGFPGTFRDAPAEHPPGRKSLFRADLPRNSSCPERRRWIRRMRFDSPWDHFCFR